MQVGIAAGAYADGHVFLAVFGKHLGQGRSQQDPPGLLGHPLQVRFHCGDGLVRVEVAHQKSVGGQSMTSGVASRDHAGGVGTGHGRVHRMVVGESHSASGEGGQVGHQPFGHLRRLKPVENHDQYLCHTTPRPATPDLIKKTLTRISHPDVTR